MARPLPDDLRRLLAVEPRIVDVKQAPYARRAYGSIERLDDPEARIAGHIDRLTQPGGRERHPALVTEEPWWLAEVAPLGNPVLIADEQRVGDFPEASPLGPQWIALRPVEPGEEENG
jgi:hypothetical protein